MHNLIYKTSEILILESFEIGHSVLKFKGLDNENIIIQFQGMSYVELPRILNGVEIARLTEDEQKDLLNRRPKLRGKTNFWKMVSETDTYYIAALNVEFMHESDN